MKIASHRQISFTELLRKNDLKFIFFVLGTFFGLFFSHTNYCHARIRIDINSPSVRKFNIAIPNFKNLNADKQNQDLSLKLSEVISSDLDLSGYFNPMDKRAFLEADNAGMSLEEIRFKDWSVIGAELLIKGSYFCIGSRLEVHVRLFDVFGTKQILGKRVLGEKDKHRRLIHRLGNDIIKKLTGHDGMFLSKLAFVGNKSGHKEIYACDFDGHNRRNITDDESIALLPRWSPDGTKIIYNSYKDGWPMLYMKTLANGNVVRVSGRKGLNIGAAWAPDGKKLALTLSRRGNPDIFTIGTKGNILGRLTDHWGIDVSPAFSPDGNKVAFVSSRSGSPQIYVKDLVKGREDRLTFFEGNYNTSPTWSKLNRIAFVSMNHGRFEIYSMNSEGGQLRKLTENSGNNEDPCWSPDGRYIVFSSNRSGKYNLYIMTANGQNQNRITFMEGDQTAPSWID